MHHQKKKKKKKNLLESKNGDFFKFKINKEQLFALNKVKWDGLGILFK